MMVILLVTVCLVFLVRYKSDGAAWAAFASNDHTNSDGVMIAGQVRDRNGILLLSTENGERVYPDDWTTRVATLHAVGDPNGYIGGSAVSLFQKQLMGYSMLNGVYSLNGEGRDVYLTIDAELNKVAWQALDGRDGCVAVMNYITGEILVMVSSPSFDPANPPEDPYYLNNFLSGLYPPGSIFKVLTAQAALETLPDIHDYHYTCTGSQEYDGGTITCQEAHGELDFYQALAVSCNCAFADLAQKIGGETLAAYAKKAGLTADLEINGFPLVSGDFAIAPTGSMELGWSGVGQYQTLITPYAMLRYISAIANGGKAVEANLLKKVTTAGGIPTKITLVHDTTRIMSETVAAELKEMLANNVRVKYGVDRFPGLPLCAKSGTAEVATGASPHAWFTGFLNSEEYPYAFIVLVENGGSGSTVAGEVANKVLQAAVAR